MINLRDVLSIPSVSKREDRVIEFVLDFCQKNNLNYHIDEKRNIYVQKGSVNKDEYFPIPKVQIDLGKNIYTQNYGW